MQRLSAAGGVLAVHAEDDDIVMFMNRKLHEEERTGTEFLHEAHNNVSEDMAFRRVIRMAEHTGAAIYLMHVSAGEGWRQSQKGEASGSRYMERRCTISLPSTVRYTGSPMVLSTIPTPA